MNADWQPIATAPKDGTEVLVVWRGRVTLAMWRDDVPYPAWQEGPYGDFSIRPDEVTHWRPLPSPPSDSGVDHG